MPQLTLWDLYEAISAESRNLQFSQFGEFELGSYLLLNTWDKPNMGCFECTEECITQKKKLTNRAIAITHSMLLQLELSRKNPEIGRVTFMSTLGALHSVKRSNTDDTKLVFQWKSVGNIPEFTQIFTFRNREEFLDLLILNMMKLGASVKIRKSANCVDENDVSPKSIQKLNIQAVTQQISQLEATHSDNDTGNLVELYQLAIGYYSALNNPKFKSYLQKLQHLIKNNPISSFLGTEASK